MAVDPGHHARSSSLSHGDLPVAEASVLFRNSYQETRTRSSCAETPPSPLAANGHLSTAFFKSQLCYPTNPTSKLNLEHAADRQPDTQLRKIVPDKDLARRCSQDVSDNERRHSALLLSFLSPLSLLSLLSPLSLLLYFFCLDAQALHQGVVNLVLIATPPLAVQSLSTRSEPQLCYPTNPTSTLNVDHEADRRPNTQCRMLDPQTDVVNECRFSVFLFCFSCSLLLCLFSCLDAQALHQGVVNLVLIATPPLAVQSLSTRSEPQLCYPTNPTSTLNVDHEADRRPDTQCRTLDW